MTVAVVATPLLICSIAKDSRLFAECLNVLVLKNLDPLEEVTIHGNTLLVLRKQAHKYNTLNKALSDLHLNNKLSKPL